MAEHTEDALSEAIRLATKFKTNFVELGKLLLQLHVEDPSLVKAACEASGLGARKAFYLVEIVKRIQNLPIPTGRLAAIGWTKTQIIARFLTLQCWQDLLTLAECNSARDLKLMMKGVRPTPGTRSVLLYLTPSEYKTFADAVANNGGEVNGASLPNKEKALMTIIAKAEAML